MDWNNNHTAGGGRAAWQDSELPRVTVIEHHKDAVLSRSEGRDITLFFYSFY
jgi:hypothetical protein